MATRQQFCIVCAKAFTAVQTRSRHWPRTCSDDCRYHRQSIPERPCPFCTKPFTPSWNGLKAAQRAGRQVCCSPSCSRRMYPSPGLAVARVTNLRRGTQAVQRRAIDVFGVLSDRERRIFNFAAHEGYKRGYGQARALYRRDPSRDESVA